MSKNKCPHCGVKWEKHLGVSPTCKQLGNAEDALRVIQTWATLRSGEALVPDHVAALCRKVLKGES